MGILDDAIREHLELKRRRGADPAEIERAEHEALGPVRPAPDTITADDLAAGGPGADGPGDSPASFADEAAGAFPHDEAGTQLHETPIRPEADFDGLADLGTAESEHPAAPSPAPAELGGPATHEADAALPHAHDPSVAPAAEGYSASGEETVEYSLPDEFVHGETAPVPPTEPPTPPAPGATPAKAEEGEDLLEDTPEFLQDTPDHDRLWFEQKPPRDFDFDH